MEAGKRDSRMLINFPDKNYYLLELRSVPYAALAKAFSLIEATTKRIEKVTLLTSLLLLVMRRSSPDDHKSLLQIVYLCVNRVGFPELQRSVSSSCYVAQPRLRRH